jgi:hypothetical protein
MKIFLALSMYVSRLLLGACIFGNLSNLCHKHFVGSTIHYKSGKTFEEQITLI